MKPVEFDPENEHRKQKLAELRAKITAGNKQIRQHKVVDGEAVLQQLQAKLAQMSQGE